MGVTGRVLNGSNNYRIDRANDLRTFGSCCPPMNKSQRERCLPPVNVAFRRSAIGPGPIPAGRVELEVTPRLFNDRVICVHDGMTVTHVQSHGFWGTILTHSDDGRATVPLVFLLSCCHAADEVAGILAGPGRSPARLH